MIIEINIDPSKELAIKQGQKVDFHTGLYTRVQTEEQRIEIAAELSVSPKHILSHLKKSVGDTVQSGEILAEAKSLFHTKHVSARIQGIIKEIDHIEGIILIESIQTEASEYCWFAGEVVEVSKKKVGIKVGKHHVYNAKSVESDFGGLVWYSSLNEDIPERPVALAEKLNAYEGAKLSALGGVGMITTEEYTFETELPRAIFKLNSDCQNAVIKHFSYCLVQKEHSTIIFYSV